MAKLDLSLLKNSPREGINIPDSEIQKAIDSVRKKEAQEKVLEKKVKSLDKIIDKTDKLILKDKQNKEKKKTTKPQSNYKKTTPRLQKSCNVSKVDYLCLKKFPRKVMDILVQKSILKGSYLECVIDVEEIKDITGESAKTVRTAFYRLKRRGFFIEVHSSTNGMRVIKLKPEIFY